jgi:hypothetical protein
VRILSAPALLIAGLFLAAAPAAAADLTLRAAESFILPVEVNGQMLRLRIDPAAPGYVLLNPDSVGRLGLRGSMIGSVTHIGPVTLKGGSNSVKMRVGGVATRPRAIWIDREVAPGADGTISPELLPYDIIVFELAPPRPGEVESQVALDYAPGIGLVHLYPAGEKRIQVGFTLADARSQSTAAAGALLASLHGGDWTGPAREEPVRFGVRRPVRPFGLAAPVRFGAYEIRYFLVRTADFRGSYQLPSDRADPDEIVVTAATKGKQRARLHLQIGADALASCSSLTYAKAPRRLTLRCNQGQ